MNEVCGVEDLKVRAIEAGHQLAGKEGLSRSVLSTIKHDLYIDTHKSLMKSVDVRILSNL